MTETTLQIEDDSRNHEQLAEWTVDTERGEYRCTAAIAYAHFEGGDYRDPKTWKISSSVYAPEGCHTDARMAYVNHADLREEEHGYGGHLDNWGSAFRGGEDDDYDGVRYTFQFTTEDVEYVREVTTTAAHAIAGLIEEYGTSHEEERTFEVGETIPIDRIPDGGDPEWIDERRIGAEYGDTRVTYECKEVEVVDVADDTADGQVQ